MIRAGIIGGSGYTGGELIRLLLNHPEVHLDFVYSRTREGLTLHSTFPDLIGHTDLKYTSQPKTDVDVVFLCLGHGNSGQFLQKWVFDPGTRIIDLSNEFRLKGTADYKGRSYLYGLPEHQADQISKARFIANPGCFATGITLALLPLARAKVLKDPVHINAVTGSTGAGAGLSETTHFSWRNNNHSLYKPFVHQHLAEIRETLGSYGNPVPECFFLPQRGNFPRGIFATAYTPFQGSLQDARDLYESFYREAPFTLLTDMNPNLKQVVNTNAVHLHLHKHNGVLLITSILDNLLKGASGQAVENMNLMFGIPRDTGLKLKAIGF